MEHELRKVDTSHSLESQLSKRKPATPSKHAHSPKTAAKAQQAAQAIVRSPKDGRLRLAEAAPTESPPKRDDNSPHEALSVEQQALSVEQEALPAENPATPLENPATALETALEDGIKQTMTNNDSKKGTNFSSATANVQAYQAKLLEMAQANMQFSFEFAQRLATIRSPLEFPSVIAEFTSKRMAMFRKHSTELAELSIKR
jgi:Phasin protein